MRYGERFGVSGTLGWVMRCLALTFVCVGASDAAPWTHWRGPLQNGVATETGLPSAWSPEGENLLWKADVIVRSTPVLMNGRAYVLARVGKDITEQEQVACFDVKTGEMLWEDRFNLYHTTVPFNRVGWTSPAGDLETGYIYAHGVGGVFNCYTSDGQIVWSRSLTEELGRVSGYGGRTNTPIVDENLVILGYLNASWGDQAPTRNRFFAFDKKSGEVVWTSALPGPPLDTYYSVPVVAEMNGQRLLITGAADGSIYALRARTGEIAWQFKLSKRGINVSVTTDGDRVYAAHSEENLDSNAMGRVVCIDGRGTGDITKTGEVWRNDGLEVGYASLAFHDGRLYAIDNAANLIAIDGATGKIHWKHSLGTVGKGSPTIADGKIYAPEVNGVVHILEPRESECVTLDTDKIMMPDGRGAEIYGSPAVAYGRVFIPTEAGLFCVGNADTPVQDSVPELSGVTKASDDKPAKLQILPAEIAIRPGESVKFRVRLFDDHGSMIADNYEDPKVEWSLNRLFGTVRPDGTFTAEPEEGPHAGTLTATFGDLKASARVRVVPTLPYEEDFEKVEVGAAPGFWIGSAGKMSVVEKDGNRVLHQPPARVGLSNASVYIGASDEAGYGVQVDVMGTKPRRNMPDMGLIVGRYTMALQGNHQRVQVYDWASDLRVSAEVPYKWEPDVWYSLKMQVDVSADKAVVYGKVWRKGDTEPEAWTVTMEDPLPNRVGSPGIYGFAFADLYFDNLRITKRE